MLRYDRQTKPGLVALYDIRPGNSAGPFLQPRGPHGAQKIEGYTIAKRSVWERIYVETWHDGVVEQEQQTNSCLVHLLFHPVWRHVPTL